MAGILFEKSLSDLVKGIRASKRDTGLYISSCIAEIKTELNSTNPFTKANALQKMTFLQMMGYNMSWASFATVEVMSSPRFAHKRIGYLAACQAFNQDTEVVLLTTNLLKKELRGASGGRMDGIYEAGLAINCVSNIVTEDLARELLSELTSLTSHPQPYIRKKAIMCLFKLFVKYPQGLRLTFDQIRKSLDDAEPAVVSCAVNVITELSDKNPKNYLHLAPAFFNLLTSSSNNWMLIKVVKLLGSLVSEEPRLARKLLEPLAGIVKNTQAKSLLYEAVYTITLALPYCRRSDGTMPPNVPEIVELCAQTLQIFVQEEDQNLKYLGLVGLNSLTISHPKILASGGAHRDLILQCLSDEDVTIRSRALELLTGMATRKNLKELIGQLLHHVDLAEGAYKADLVGKIVFMCSMEKYSLIPDFQWYLATLIRLAHVRGIEKDHGQLLKSQIMDVALRVLPVRKYAVVKMARILLDQKHRRTDAKEEFIIANVLSAAAWIVGEYAHLIWDASQDEDSMMEFNSLGPYHAIVTALLHTRSVLLLDAETQAVYIQSAMKVFAAACFQKKAKPNESEACVNLLHENLPIFAESSHKEVQERAFSLNQLLRSLGLDQEKPLEKADVDIKTDKKGDLLTLTMGGNSSVTSSTPGSIANRCQQIAETLNYLLTPDPMKPISAKAQRKKRVSPSNQSIDLDAPVDISAFESILQSEKKHRHNGPTMDDVDFTEQRRMGSIEQNPPIASAPVSADPFADQRFNAETSFQQSNGSFQNTQLTGQNQRQHDPFYLNSGGDPLETTRAQNNKFGMIQLVSDDENGDGHDSKKKTSKKKESKKKKKSSKAKKMAEADLNFLANSGESRTNESHSHRETIEKDVTILESDDDDDDEENDALDIFAPHKSTKKNLQRKANSGKEFSGLAKVDLTAPLREDEVMPISTHRQVPERREIFPHTKETKKKKKKEKKNKKKSREVEPSNVGSNAEIGDLLDFGGFTATDTSQNTSTPMVSAVNSAFDDLLGLEQPTLEAPTTINNQPSDAGMQTVSSSSKSNKRRWQKCAIKLASAKGKSTVDWKDVSIDCLTYQAKSQGRTAASIMLRLTNKSESITLHDVMITLDSDPKHQISLGDVGPKGQTSESSTKTGPFLYPENDEGNFDIRGKLKASGSTVPIKITLPASMFLSPVTNLTQDDVMQELSRGRWEEGSTKMELKSIEAGLVLPLLCAFLRAGEVVGNRSEMGTLAAVSKNGSQVRLLVKVKKDSAKIDVKCTDKKLCASILSDLKRVHM